MFSANSSEKKLKPSIAAFKAGRRVGQKIAKEAKANSNHLGEMFQMLTSVMNSTLDSLHLKTSNKEEQKTEVTKKSSTFSFADQRRTKINEALERTANTEHQILLIQLNTLDAMKLRGSTTEVHIKRALRDKLRAVLRLKENVFHYVNSICLDLFLRQDDLYEELLNSGVENHPFFTRLDRAVSFLPPSLFATSLFISINDLYTEFRLNPPDYKREFDILSRLERGQSEELLAEIKKTRAFVINETEDCIEMDQGILTLSKRYNISLVQLGTWQREIFLKLAAESNKHPQLNESNGASLQARLQFGYALMTLAYKDSKFDPQGDINDIMYRALKLLDPELARITLEENMIPSIINPFASAFQKGLDSSSNIKVSIHSNSNHSAQDKDTPTEPTIGKRLRVMDHIRLLCRSDDLDKILALSKEKHYELTARDLYWATEVGSRKVMTYLLSLPKLTINDRFVKNNDKLSPSQELSAHSALDLAVFSGQAWRVKLVLTHPHIRLSSNELEKLDLKTTNKEFDTLIDSYLKEQANQRATPELKQAEECKEDKASTVSKTKGVLFAPSPSTAKDHEDFYQNFLDRLNAFIDYEIPFHLKDGETHQLVQIYASLQEILRFLEQQKQLHASFICKLGLPLSNQLAEGLRHARNLLNNITRVGGVAKIHGDMMSFAKAFFAAAESKNFKSLKAQPFYQQSLEEGFKGPKAEVAKKDSLFFNSALAIQDLLLSCVKGKEEMPEGMLGNALSLLKLHREIYGKQARVTANSTPASSPVVASPKSFKK